MPAALAPSFALAPRTRARLEPRASRRSRSRRRASPRHLTLASGSDGPDRPDASSSSSSSSSFLSFLCPLLKAFSGGDAAAPRNRTLEVATSGFASIARLPFGTTVDPACAARGSDRPAPTLVLYEFQACPFCLRVREALTQLDLDAEIRPCPKGARRHRDEVVKRGGKASFPFLVDETAGVEMYESEDIVRHLYAAYGEGAPFPDALVSTTALTGWMPTLFRAGRGMTRYERPPPGGQAGEEEEDSAAKEAAAEPPAAPLELYNYEGNQFARLVREALCELEIPYFVRNVGKGSPRREALRALDEGASVPYLVDPNTGVRMGESEEIVKYLFETYG